MVQALTGMVHMSDLNRSTLSTPGENGGGGGSRREDVLKAVLRGAAARGTPQQPSQPVQPHSYPHPHPHPRHAAAEPSASQRSPIPLPAALQHRPAVPDIEAVLPSLPVSQHVKRHLWQAHLKRAEAALRNSATTSRKPSAPVLLAEETRRRQASTLARANDDAARQQRVQAELASKAQAIKVRRAVYEQRRTSAQLKQFYNKYHLKQQSQQLRRRTGEELAVRRMFEQYTKEATDRARLSERYVKEQQQLEDQKRQDEIISYARWFDDQVELFEAARKAAQTDSKADTRATERELVLAKQEMQHQIVQEQAHIFDELDYSAYSRVIDAVNAFPSSRLAAGARV